MNFLAQAPFTPVTRTSRSWDELLEVLRDTKRELSRTESKQIEQELAQIRARLLRDNSFSDGRTVQEKQVQLKHGGCALRVFLSENWRKLSCMKDPERPDPDALLAQMKRAEA